MTFTTMASGPSRVPALSAIVGAALAAVATLGGCGNLDDHLGAQNVGYRPDGTLVVYTVQDIRIFDGQLGQMLGAPTPVREADPNQDAHGFALSEDGATAAVSYMIPSRPLTSRNAVKLWHLPTGEVAGDIDIDAQPKPPLSRNSNVGLVALSPAGDLFFAQNRASDPDAPVGRNSDSGVFRASDGARLWGGYWLTSPVFSADGQTLYAVTRWDSGVSPDVFDLAAFDATTGNVKFSVHMSPAAADIDLVAGGTQIAGVWSWDGGGAGVKPLGIAFWSALDGTLIRMDPALAPGALYGTQSQGAPAFACWHGGDLCAAGTTDGILIWNVDGALVRGLPRTPTPFGIFGFANDVAFSPDGKLLAVAGDATRVFRVADGALVSEQQFRTGLF